MSGFDDYTMTQKRLVCDAHRRLVQMISDVGWFTSLDTEILDVFIAVERKLRELSKAQQQARLDKHRRALQRQKEREIERSGGTERVMDEAFSELIQQCSDWGTPQGRVDAEQRLRDEMADALAAGRRQQYMDGVHGQGRRSSDMSGSEFRQQYEMTWQDSPPTEWTAGQDQMSRPTSTGQAYAASETSRARLITQQVDRMFEQTRLHYVQVDQRDLHWRAVLRAAIRKTFGDHTQPIGSAAVVSGTDLMHVTLRVEDCNYYPTLTREEVATAVGRAM